MEWGSYCLILIVAICLIALYCISKRQKELDARIHSMPDDKDETTKTESEDEMPVGPAINTIYAFGGNRAVWRCPFCDGENDACAATCAICGEDIALERSGRT